MKTKHIFDFMTKCSADGINIGDSKTYQLECCFPDDLSCHRKVLNMGRACKFKKMFCHLCGRTSDRCANFWTGSQRCDSCKKTHVGQCHHHIFDDEAEITKKKQQMRQLELKYPHLKDIEVDASHLMFQLLSDPNDRNRKNMPDHIDYEGKSRSDKLSFSSTVTEQLFLRKLSTEGRVGVRVEILREALFDQDKYLTICDTVDRYYNAIDKMLLPIMRCIPCIMHLHNRVVKKNVMLIKKAIASKEEKDIYIDAVEHTIFLCYWIHLQQGALASPTKRHKNRRFINKFTY